MSTGKNNIEGLREHLFDALAKLKDGKIDVATARAVSDIGQTIINTARVEIDYAKATKTDVSTGFIPRRIDALPAAEKPAAPAQLADKSQPEPDQEAKPAQQEGQPTPFVGNIQRFTAEDTTLPPGVVGVLRHRMAD
jgi:hypothetical protein